MIQALPGDICFIYRSTMADRTGPNEALVLEVGGRGDYWFDINPDTRNSNFEAYLSKVSIEIQILLVPKAKMLGQTIYYQEKYPYYLTHRLRIRTK